MPKPLPELPTPLARITWILDRGEVGSARAWAKSAGLSVNYVNTAKARLRSGDVSTLKGIEAAKLEKAAHVPVGWLLHGGMFEDLSLARRQAIVLMGNAIHPRAAEALMLEPVPTPDRTIAEWKERAHELNALVETEHTPKPSSEVRQSRR